MDVGQTVDAGGVTTYSFNGYAIIADGVTRSVSDADGDYTTLALCQADQFVETIDGVFHDPSGDIPLYQTIYTHKLTNGNLL